MDVVQKLYCYAKDKGVKVDYIDKGISFNNGIDTFVIIVERIDKTSDIVLLHKNIFLEKGHKRNKIYGKYIDYHIQKTFKKLKEPTIVIDYALRHNDKWTKKKR